MQLNWLPEPQFGGIYAAQARGAFAARGLEVTIRKGGPDVPAVALAASGKVEFALAAADEVVRIRAGGADVVSVFATYQTSPQGLMTYAARGLKSIEELLRAGGTLAVQPGLTYVEFLRKKYGLDAVELVTYQGGIGQFLARKDALDFAQQCFVTSEPIAARRAGVEPATFLIAETGLNPYTSVIITRSAYLAEHRNVVRSFCEALREGWEAYLHDPAPANAVMRGLNPSLDAETFALAAEAQVPLIRTEETRARGLGCQTPERWATLVRQLEDLGAVPAGAVKPEDCFLDLLGAPAPAPGK
ncbi:MAG: ABC transporter substrate-binding protein [Planctomycetota bacterium]|nr:MAG: ABC transporter substrate-binding protein [Planctomycetota bacterium]